MGDFEIMSQEGRPNQRKTITYGAYMTLGRPKLRIATIATPNPSATTVIRHGYSSGAGQDSDVMETVLEQISRTPGHNAIGAHHPQQPPYMAAAPVVVTQPTIQRHPQQPPGPQNPQIELLSGSPASNGPIFVSTTGMSSNSAHGSMMLSPQIRGSVQHAGSPSSLTSPAKKALDLFQSWWKQVMAPVVALLLVIIIINVAAFQETRITSLDLVGMPAWKRPFARIGQLWYDSGFLQYNHHHNHPHRSQQQQWEQHSDENFDVPAFEGPWTTIAYVTPQSKPTVATGTLHAKEAPRPNDLELRQPEVSKKEFEDEERSRQQQQEQQQPRGFFRLMQILKDIVRGLAPSLQDTEEEE